jgi:hypothetical protein
MTSGAGRTEADRYRAMSRAIRGLLPALKHLEVRDELSSLADAYDRLAVHAVLVRTELTDWRRGGPAGGDSRIILSIKPLRSDELQAGASYDSWMCQRCAEVIALPRRPAQLDPLETPDAVIRLSCPHCSAQRHYTIHERRVRQYPWATN